MTIIDDYLDYQAKYEKEYGQNTCVLMQVGHFYEAYAVDNEKEQSNSENIYRLSDILNIQLTRKNKSIKENTRGNPLMIGVNIFSIDKYIQLLLNNYYTTVLIEQTTPPPEPDREVTAIYSPGTNIVHLSKGDTNNLMVIYIESNKKINTIQGELVFIGLASIDVSIGNTTIYETFSKIDDKNLALDEAYRFIQTHDPKEIVIYSNNCHIDKSQLMKYLELNNRVVHYKTDVESHIFNIQYQKTFLEKIYPKTGLLSVIEYLDLEFITYGTIAFILVLEFAFKHNETIVKNISKPDIWNENKYLILTNNSINQLNLVSSQETVNTKFNSLFGVINNTSTSLGRRKLKDMLLNPIIDTEELNRRYNIIEYLMVLNDAGDINYKYFETSLTKIMDIERLHRKMSLGLLQPADFVGLDISYENIVHMLEIDTRKNTELEKIKPCEITKNSFFNFIKEYRRQFDMNEICKYHLDKINDSFFNPGNHSEIDIIKQKIERDKKYLQTVATRLSDLIEKDSNFVHLDYNERDGHYLYLTTKRLKILKQKFKITKNYPIKIDDSISINPIDLEFKTCTKTNVKIYNTTLKNISNNLRYNRDKIGLIVRKKYLEKIAEFDNEYGATLKKIVEYVAIIDFYKSSAKTALKYGYCKPHIHVDSKESFVNSEDLRHPIIERIQEDIEYVPNDLSLNSEQNKGILLFGTNASGKSSLMKAIGLNIIMAQAGMYVAASKFEFSVYKYVFTRINNNDNLFKGESSFAVEMNELRGILKRANKNSLVLGDELCSGTESVSALSIFAASVDFLVSKKASFIFATHLHELCKMDIIKSLKDSIKLYHLKVIYDQERDKLIYNRKLTEGSGNAIYGLEVCKAMDMDLNFLKKANEIRQKLMGIDNQILENKQSKYNSKVYVDKCLVCGEKAEDVHHIKFQCSADTNNMIGHIQKDTKSNLVTLCKGCHNKVHNDNLVINGYIQTNDGVKLDYHYINSQQNEEKRNQRKKYNPEQVRQIEEYLQNYKNLSQKVIALKIENELKLKVSIATLSKIKKKTY